MTNDPFLDRLAPDVRGAFKELFAKSPWAESCMRLAVLSGDVTHAYLCSSQARDGQTCQSERDAMKLPAQTIRVVGALLSDRLQENRRRLE